MPGEWASGPVSDFSSRIYPSQTMYQSDSSYYAMKADFTMFLDRVQQYPVALYNRQNSDSSLSSVNSVLQDIQSIDNIKFEYSQTAHISLAWGRPANYPEKLKKVAIKNSAKTPQKSPLTQQDSSDLKSEASCHKMTFKSVLNSIARFFLQCFTVRKQ